MTNPEFLDFPHFPELKELKSSSERQAVLCPPRYNLTDWELDFGIWDLGFEFWDFDMPYLIDGHNLIPKTPGLSLDDPHDEAKLVALVRRHCMRERRKATIIFDGGLPGGVSNLSNSDVTVVFASDRHASADDLILNRIATEKNPAGLIVVTSDQRLAEAARARRMTVRPSGEFARALKPGASAKKTEKESGLSGDDVDEWEKFFSSGH